MSSAPSQSRHHPGATALVLGSCISLQFGAALATTLFPHLGAWGVTTLRLGFAAVVLLVLARPRVRRWPASTWRTVLLFGVALAGMNGAFYAAIDRIPLGTAVAIEFLGPLVLAAVLSRRGRDLAWVGLALVGILLLGLDSIRRDASLDPVGVLWALVAAAFWAGYILASARAAGRTSGTGGLAVAVAVATVLVLPFGASGAAFALADPSLLVVALATALLASVIPYSLELAALRRIPKHVFGVLLSLEPAVAALAGLLLLDQHVGPLQLIAIGCVVLASAGITLAGSVPKRRRTRERVVVPA
ncbi:EamA family transporter [Nakamurella leprariae]|uniref:EamA family transporter n=1 Tax=Nakamurella leprariae TaxID=2803911 RepID=A0A939C3G5_9ACTN|nr:EamA family transporter [Nakamurella leprariae]MBM9469077.1 EamA family transporter [Nakamurella leprariae]